MKDKVALITGGAGHLGREIAKSLVSMEVQVIILDKSREHGEAFVKELNAEYGVQSYFLEADLLDPNCFTGVYDFVKSTTGRLDHLVNNAAFYDDIPGWGVPFEEEGYEAWQKVLQVNLMAPFFLTQALVPLLRQQEYSAIVNVSSIYGVVGPDHSLYEGTDMTNPAAYAASKGGLVQLSRWLGSVLAPHIRVNTVTPGGIERGQDEQFVNRYRKKTPLDRMAVESEVAHAVRFLLSTDSSYITGHNLMVDGGWSAI